MDFFRVSLVITSLRILKSSSVYRDHRIVNESLTFHPHSATRRTTFSLFTNIALGEKCEIEKEDIPELIAIFKFLINKNETRFVVACRRLFLGVGRQELIDRLIDYMIGLEALYSPDGHMELTFRLSIRAACLLKSKPDDKKDTYRFIKKMYDIRSSIVHGNTCNPSLKKDDVDNLEEILRESIKLWISNKNNFDKDNLDNILFNLPNLIPRP